LRSASASVLSPCPLTRYAAPGQGPYGIKFAGADSDSGSTLFCVDLAFSIVPAPHGLLLGKTLMPGLGGVLGGAVLRDGLAELRAAFEAAASGQEEPQWAAALL
jgi:hypothetical protein